MSEIEYENHLIDLISELERVMFEMGSKYSEEFMSEERANIRDDIVNYIYYRETYRETLRQLGET